MEYALVKATLMGQSSVLGDQRPSVKAPMPEEPTLGTLRDIFERFFFFFF